jgi:hypothetical protein
MFSVDVRLDTTAGNKVSISMSLRSLLTLRSLLLLVFAVGLSAVVLPAESSAQTTDWMSCAREGETCSFTGTQQVRYGANGLYAYRTLSDGTACTNAVFGDPAPGIPKQCDTGATSTSTGSWTLCANEGGTCAFTGTQQVRYGANGLYAYKTLSGGTACTNDVFGEPAPGIAKQCHTSTSSASTSWSLCATENGFCPFAGTEQVRYGANGWYAYRTLTGGTACTNSVFGDPAPGMAKQCATGATSVAPPPSTSSYGPQATITCPADAIDIWPGQPIQDNVTLYPGTTTFCLRAGVHYLTSSITPKTGNTFVGEYGAILDGSDWSTTESTQAAFRAHNQDIDYVTIRNLVIRKMPQKGIHAFPWMSDRWIVEYTEIMGGHAGIQLGNESVLRHSWIHDNVGNPFSPIPSERGGGYSVYQATDVLFEHNEISYNGPEQKVTVSTNVTFRDNFVHHNRGDGIWYDGDNVGSIIERNRVEDHPGSGIFYEISGQGVIRTNVVRRSGDHGVFISTSKDVEIDKNSLEDNLRGIQYFVDCGLVGGGAIGWDLTSDIARDNLVIVGAATGSYASGLSHSTNCAPGQVAAYLSGSKRLQFADNRYSVPSTIGYYWLWGFTSRPFSDWQMLGLDRQGSVF